MEVLYALAFYYICSKTPEYIIYLPNEAVCQATIQVIDRIDIPFSMEIQCTTSDKLERYIGQYCSMEY
jgi:hypothetical protein